MAFTDGRTKTEMELSRHRKATIENGLVHLESKSALLQSHAERLNEIIAMYNTARHTDEAICNPDLEPIFFQHVRVRHHSTSSQDALGSAKVLA